MLTWELATNACLWAPLILNSQSPLGRAGDDEAETTASLVEDGVLQLALVERLPGIQAQNLDALTGSRLICLLLEPVSQEAGGVSRS